MRGDRISYVGRKAPPARRTLDGRGRVLAPGFVDTNLPGFVPEGTLSELKLLDGATTYLSAHGGLPGDNLTRQGKRAVLNYATTVGLAGVRDRLEEPGFDYLAVLDEALRAGAYGVSLAPEYDPEHTTPERVQVICAHFGPQAVPVSFHARFSSRERELEGLEEAFECARHGAPVHVLHVSSTGGTWHPREAAAVAARARDLGLTFFFDFYPYTSWASGIQRARFRGDWIVRYGVGWESVHIAGRPERLDAELVEMLRRTGHNYILVVESIPQETVDFFALETDATLGSDTIGDVPASHPRTAGSFAKLIHDYVHTGRMPLGKALHRLSTQPCERFAPYIPDLARRGRIEVGYYADLVLLEPDAIRDHATVRRPLEPSSGVHAALVNGVPVVEAGRYLRPSQETGRWLKGRLHHSESD